MLQCNLFDLGQEIISVKNETVDLSALPEGVYIVKAELSNKETYSSKLIKK